MNKFNKFYNKSINERRSILEELDILKNIDKINLDEDTANLMIENYILNYQIPLGVALNFKIDNEKYIIPMATEEPSVIAAASNGAKILGNISTQIDQKAIIGQVVLTNLDDIDKAYESLEKNKEKLFKMAQEQSQSMIKRGGGPRKIWFKKFDKEFLTIYISIDTCDAMGANTINSILEYISSYLEEITSGEYILRILSNNSTESVVKASANISLEKLSKNKEEAINIAKRIVLATKYANTDPYRASTHNKGIMNGVDAVVLATGNDFRAVEAAAHTYAAKDGQYRSLTSYEYDKNEEILRASIEIPLPVATLGGTISVHDIAKKSLEILNNPNAKQLASIIASVGLAQNFSAIKAIVTEGIQKGHMNLHAKSVAKQAGASEDEIDKLVKRLNTKNKINLENAKKALKELRNE